MVVDTEGHLLLVLVLPADVSDRDGAVLVLQDAPTHYPRLQLVWGDHHYGGDLGTEIEAALGIVVVVVPKLAEQTGFVPLPRRWVVERTFSWLGQNRRMSKDYERLCASAEAFIYAAMIRLMVRRLVRT